MGELAVSDPRMIQTPALQLPPAPEAAGKGVIAEILDRLDRIDKVIGKDTRRAPSKFEPLEGSGVEPLTDED